MPIRRRFITAVLALAVIVARVPAHPNMLGVVTQAKDANLSTGPVSAGTTVYDGDRLSTQADGALTFRSGTAMLYLARESRVTLRSLPDKPNGMQAELSAGTLVFSGARVSAVEIFADDARIRAVADAPTIGQITVIGPKTLDVHARQGSLMFSYEDESEVIPEGKYYRVLLDPPDDNSTAKPGDTTSSKPTKRRRKAFVFVLIGAAAAGSAAAAVTSGAMVKQLKSFESPDHP